MESRVRAGCIVYKFCPLYVIPVEILEGTKPRNSSEGSFKVHNIVITILI
jgi:hypothetical protein